MKYLTAGFTEDEGSFAVITKQRFAILDQGASREIVERYLYRHGFIRLKNDDYFSKTMSVKLGICTMKMSFLMKMKTYCLLIR